MCNAVLEVTFIKFVNPDVIEIHGYVPSFLFSFCQRILNRDTWLSRKAFGLGQKSNDLLRFPKQEVILKP